MIKANKFNKVKNIQIIIVNQLNNNKKMILKMNNNLKENNNYSVYKNKLKKNKQQIKLIIKYLLELVLVLILHNFLNLKNRNN